VHINIISEPFRPVANCLIVKCTAAKILSSFCIILTKQQRLSVTRPFDSSLAIYYRRSIVIMRLSCTVMKIWRLKDNGVTSVTFWITRRHRSRKKDGKRERERGEGRERESGRVKEGKGEGKKERKLKGRGMEMEKGRKRKKGKEKGKGEEKRRKKKRKRDRGKKKERGKRRGREGKGKRKQRDGPIMLGS